MYELSSLGLLTQGILRWSGIQFSLRNPKVIKLSETKENKGQPIIKKPLRVIFTPKKSEKMDEPGKNNNYYYYYLLYF